ncbi:FAD-dependent pyridine nucleotide-disulfide oxidoreductase [Neobacillus massiliamazoniensis]|uniref:NADH:ubiquinone reductase (non-electrogenic) n=2 Tax=Neobacillus massiliamazoniensis TaxID=1499688 RepID=A0A0U1NYP3_9BACI|nr:FAD-dependent oxidoreductase [Neobacillus massiliamazoniensis]CRK83149.1 FAD-dependent pyridine nucleotide-disulfide oxidoreductase [Neobacillus massiliamazoniensis]
MKDLTCIIIGGGYAGLAALKAIKEKNRGNANGRRIRLVLFDKQPGHLRKLRLFRPTTVEEEIMIPWKDLVLEGFEFVQGTVTSVNSVEKRIRYIDTQGNDARIHYDFLVVAVGSIVRGPDPDQGGIALTDQQAAADIRERWRDNMRKAADETNPEERKRLMTIVVAGAGISGIETSADLAIAMRKEAAVLGLNSSDTSIYLLNAQERLLPEGPEKVGRKLDQALNECGVTILHNRKALREEAGVVTLSNGDCLAVGLCIWMIGLIPNPVLRGMGLPLTPDGQVLVDECYRVQGAPGVYSIGDCTRIVDPRTGKADRMTCFEAGMQGLRLGKIVMADLEDRPAPIHQSPKSNMDYFNIGLGQNGFFWIRKWGLDMVITGKIPGKIKKLVEDYASMLR